LPANARLLREKYDTDRDGKLSQKELEAIPQPLRRLVEDRIRQRLAERESTPGEERLPVRTTDPPGLRPGRSGPTGRLPAPEKTGESAR